MDEDTVRINAPIPKETHRRMRMWAYDNQMPVKVAVPILLEKGLEVMGVPYGR